MSLVKCPECGREISDCAFACPYCGFPISKVNLELQEENTKDFIEKNESLIDEKENNIKRTNSVKNIKILIPAIVVLCIFMLLFCGYFVNYKIAKNDAIKGRFSKANKELLVKPITKVHDFNLLKYIEAGELFEKEDLKEASERFYAIKGYLNSSELAELSGLAYGQKLEDEKKFDDAIAWYEYMDENGAGNYSENLLNIRLEQVIFNYTNSNDSKTAIEEFKQLENDGLTEARKYWIEAKTNYAYELMDISMYGAAIEEIEEIKSENEETQKVYDEIVESVYNNGIDYYSKEQFALAENTFQLVQYYKQSENFIKVCNILKYEWISLDDTKKYTNILVENLDLPLMNEYIVSRNWCAIEFLKSSWKTEDGYYYFIITEDEKASAYYNIPHINGNGYYSIKNGVYSVGEIKMYTISVISENIIEITSEKNGKTYRLFRE